MLLASAVFAFLDAVFAMLRHYYYAAAAIAAIACHATLAFAAPAAQRAP